MNIRQNIRDFCAKFFSKYFWRELWLDIRAFPRKRVKAAKLVDICECINPQYSLLVECARRNLGDKGDLFDDIHRANNFYGDREKFLASIVGFPYFFREYLFERYSLDKEKERFQGLVADAGLEKHILLSDETGRETINFKKIMVEGDIELNLVGKFHYWKFNSVKFCGKVSLDIYPPNYNSVLGGMTFKKSVCVGDFSCRFAGVPHFQIEDNKFLSSMAIDIGTDTELCAFGQVDKMKEKFLEDTHVPSINFLKNRFKKALQVFSSGIDYCGFSRNLTLGKVRFDKGNYIGALILSYAIFLEGKPPMEMPSDKPINPDIIRYPKVHDIYFGTRERVKMPENKEEILRLKDFFVALKHRAIDKRDREAEFGYGRKERYFDRGLATSWQDKFPWWWSHCMSGSGISWIRPTVILLVGQCCFAAAFIGVLGGCCDYATWLQAAVESLNPLSSLRDIEKSECYNEWVNSFSASIYSAVRRIFSLALLYEIVKVLHRFYN